MVHRDSQIDHTAVHTLDQMLLPTDNTLVHNPNSVSKLRFVHTLVIVVLRLEVIRMETDTVCFSLIEELSRFAFAQVAGLIKVKLVKYHCIDHACMVTFVVDTGHTALTVTHDTLTQQALTYFNLLLSLLNSPQLGQLNIFNAEIKINFFAYMLLKLAVRHAQLRLCSIEHAVINDRLLSE